MKIKALFVFALFFFALNIHATAMKLDGWVGKYPSSKIDGKTANEILMKSGLLKKILSPKEIALLKSFTNEDVIIQNGEYILIFKCKPHDCSGSHSMIIENSSGDLWIGIYQNNGDSVSTRWCGTNEYTELPTIIQKLFIRGHTPE